jgi:hypothetical protein
MLPHSAFRRASTIAASSTSIPMTHFACLAIKSPMTPVPQEQSARIVWPSTAAISATRAKSRSAPGVFVWKSDLGAAQVLDDSVASPRLERSRRDIEQRCGHAGECLAEARDEVIAEQADGTDDEHRVPAFRGPDEDEFPRPAIRDTIEHGEPRGGGKVAEALCKRRHSNCRFGRLRQSRN